MFASESRVPGGAPTEGAPQPGDVTGALTELERKLRELQQELGSIGRRRETEPVIAAAAPPVAGRIVDEAVSAPSATTTSPGATTASRGPTPEVQPSDARLESLAELRRFRDRLERFGRELATEYDALLGRVMAGLSGAPVATPPADLSGAPAAGVQEAPPASLAAAPPPVSEADARENALFEGRVELGVGPFYDIGALGAFEQRLSSLPGVSEASVRRFEASHAVVDVRLAAPVALVKELRRALSTDFNVREVAGGRVLLTFDDA